jgi:hypothetical protein
MLLRLNQTIAEEADSYDEQNGAKNGTDKLVHFYSGHAEDPRGRKRRYF